MGCILHVSSVQSRLWSFHEILVACWLVVSTPRKNLKVSWDDEIPSIWKHKSHVQTTNQIWLSSYLYLSQYMKASFLPLPSTRMGKYILGRYGSVHPRDTLGRYSTRAGEWMLITKMYCRYWLAYQDFGGLYQPPSGKKNMACWKIQLLYLGFFHQFLWIFPFTQPPFTSGIWQ